MGRSGRRKRRGSRWEVEVEVFGVVLADRGVGAVREVGGVM